MVGKFKVKNPLTLEERRKIQQGLTLNLSYSQLAQHVGRCKSVVMRESKRLGHPSKYTAEEAQKHFEYNQRFSGIKRNSGLYKKLQEEKTSC